MSFLRGETLAGSNEKATVTGADGKPLEVSSQASDSDSDHVPFAWVAGSKKENFGQTWMCAEEWARWIFEFGN